MPGTIYDLWDRLSNLSQRAGITQPAPAPGDVGDSRNWYRGQQMQLRPQAALPAPPPQELAEAPQYRPYPAAPRSGWASPSIQELIAAGGSGRRDTSRDNGYSSPTITGPDGAALPPSSDPTPPAVGGTVNIGDLQGRTKQQTQQAPQGYGGMSMAQLADFIGRGQSQPYARDNTVRNHEVPIGRGRWGEIVMGTVPYQVGHTWSPQLPNPNAQALEGFLGANNSIAQMMQAQAAARQSNALYGEGGLAKHKADTDRMEAQARIDLANRETDRGTEAQATALYKPEYDRLIAAGHSPAQAVQILRDRGVEAPDPIRRLLGLPPTRPAVPGTTAAGAATPAVAPPGGAAQPGPAPAPAATTPQPTTRRQIAPEISARLEAAYGTASRNWGARQPTATGEAGPPSVSETTTPDIQISHAADFINNLVQADPNFLTTHADDIRQFIQERMPRQGVEGLWNTTFYPWGNSAIPGLASSDSDTRRRARDAMVNAWGGGRYLHAANAPRNMAASGGIMGTGLGGAGGFTGGLFGAGFGAAPGAVAGGMAGGALGTATGARLGELIQYLANQDRK